MTVNKTNLPQQQTILCQFVGQNSIHRFRKFFCSTNELYILTQENQYVINEMNDSPFQVLGIITSSERNTYVPHSLSTYAVIQKQYDQQKPLKDKVTNNFDNEITIYIEFLVNLTAKIVFLIKQTCTIFATSAFPVNSIVCVKTIIRKLYT